MESFYGGRQGASFVIKKSFKYLDLEDPAYWADGSSNKNEVLSEYVKDQNNKDFWYGDYCIIDTTNKNNPNNGKIFRRTIAKKQDENSLDYAEYIGQIVGPSAGAPTLEITDGGLEANEAAANNEPNNWNVLSYSNNGNGLAYNEKRDPNNPIKLPTQKLNMEKGSLVAGYSATTGETVDDIEYNWYNVRENTKQNNGIAESICRIGFKIPYTVFTFNAEYKAPGTSPEVKEQERSKDHPFWYDLLFSIPGGVRGLSVENIRISDSEVEAYGFEQLEHIELTDSYKINGGMSKRSAKSWLCDVRITNSAVSGSASTNGIYTFFIGTMIEIESVVFDSTTGELVAKYYNKESHSLGKLNFIDDVKISKDYRLLVKYNCPEQIESGKDLNDEGGYLSHGSIVAEPLIADPVALPEQNLDTIEKIINWCNTNWSSSQYANGSLYVVNTQKNNPQDEISYFIRWTKEDGWKNCGRITMNGGVPAQINNNGSISYESRNLASGATMLTTKSWTLTQDKNIPYPWR